MDVFELRRQLVDDYAEYVPELPGHRQRADPAAGRREPRAQGLLWPHPLIHLNLAFERGETIDPLVSHDVLHEECRRVFRRAQTPEDPVGRDLQLHCHHAKAVRIARTGAPCVLKTGTGSGKSLAYITPIVDFVLRRGSAQGIQAIVVYPMNALATARSRAAAPRPPDRCSARR